jgi:hypothetical protein
MALAAATEGLLRAAAARADGQLETLDVSGCAPLPHDALLEVVRADSASLRELYLRSDETRPFRPAAQVEALLRAAPGLRACPASVYTSEVVVARAMLRADPPFAALRLESLRLGDAERIIRADAVLGLAADLSPCTFMRELSLISGDLDTPAALDALLDAALACRLHTLRLVKCRLSRESAPALARLLSDGALTELAVNGLLSPIIDTLGAAAVLGACSTLTALALRDVGLGHHRRIGVAAAVLTALTGHASLRALDLSRNRINAADWAATGAALGALVAANAPALTQLDISDCDLRDEGLRPLFVALPHNTHLTKLQCGGNVCTNAFICDALLPAVRANGSLRQLSCQLQMRSASAAAERRLAKAEALVAQRAAGR